MYRLLIVDDEEIIVNGLFEIFQNLKEVDLDIYKAYSGKEAIEWMNRTRIDIILTDIKMPEIDGMQLLEEIYKNWPQCKVIFLTGYDNFDYSYHALQYKNIGYILKTEDSEKVVEAVKEAIDEIKKNNKIEGFIQEAKEQINVAKALFQKDFLIHLLHGDSTLKVDKYQFEQLGIAMEPKLPVILVMGYIESFSKKRSYWEKIEYLYSIKLIIEQKIRFQVANFVVMDDTHKFFIFIQPKELSALISEKERLEAHYKKTVTFLKGTFELIQLACSELMNTSINFFISETPCEWEKVSEKYLYFRHLLNYRIGTGLEMLITDTEYDRIIDVTSNKGENEVFEQSDIEMDASIRNNKDEWIETYFTSGEKDEFFTLLGQRLDLIKHVKSRNNPMAIEIYYKMALSILAYINERKLTNMLAFRIGQNKLMRVDMHDSWKEAVEYIYLICEVIFDIQNKESTKRSDQVIKLVREFIEEHLDEELSLVRLSEQVYLNPSYLSRLYKKVTGENLSEYIDRVRIQKAKKLMEGGNTKIHEIGKQVGYENAASFTRFFRKMTFSSPQEYCDKRLLGKEW